MYFDNDDLLEMQRRDREDEERAQASKLFLEQQMNDDTPFGRDGDHCPWGGHDWKQPCTQDCHDAGKPGRLVVKPFGNARRGIGPCPCACNSGGFCGGCGHAGCGGRR